MTKLFFSKAGGGLLSQKKFGLSILAANLGQRGKEQSLEEVERSNIFFYHILQSSFCTNHHSNTKLSMQVEVKKRYIFLIVQKFQHLSLH